MPPPYYVDYLDEEPPKPVLKCDIPEKILEAIKAGPPLGLYLEEIMDIVESDKPDDTKLIYKIRDEVEKMLKKNILDENRGRLRLYREDATRTRAGGPSRPDPKTFKPELAALYDVHDDRSCMLIEADLEGDNTRSKYFVMQLLKRKNAKELYMLYWRGGHLGNRGEIKAEYHHTTTDAEIAWKKLFREKTECSWDKYNRQYYPRPGGFDIVREEVADVDVTDPVVALGTLYKRHVYAAQVVAEDLRDRIDQNSDVSALAQRFARLVRPDILPTPTTKDQLEKARTTLGIWVRMGFDLPLEDRVDVDPMAPELFERMPVPHSIESAIACVGTVPQSIIEARELAKGNELLGALLLVVLNDELRDRLNEALREKQANVIKASYRHFLRLLTHAFDTLPKCETGVVYWALSYDLFEDYIAGAIMNHRGITSCTTNEALARHFADHAGGAHAPATFAKINTARAVPVPSGPDIAECLLPPNSKFRVITSVRTSLKLVELELEEFFGDIIPISQFLRNF
ncbi:hypothetical protein CTAYLR_004456 [Chrysophaeum taylorii]|uniref:WGR domain-containing protein n=1 Tax=Chrysophaeum taylorii TaxID=2483200 RepID=A0AAD7UE67_9STRA|nr:hypothetical protein CTAYLR_004456 [Chrysophaeum taylorii]